MELLETPALQMGCEYLSDLRYLPRPNDALWHMAADLPLERFPALKWLDAADYLCGVNCTSAKGYSFTLFNLLQVAVSFDAYEQRGPRRTLHVLRRPLVIINYWSDCI